MNHIALVALVCMTLALTGCPDPREALVFNQSSDNISSVDIAAGTVTSDVGGLTIGPLANRAVIRGTTAYVLNSGAYPGATGAGVQVINLNTLTVTNDIPLPDGDNPWDIAFVSSSKAYVTTLYGNSVVVINPLLQGGARSSRPSRCLNSPVLRDPFPPDPKGSSSRAGTPTRPTPASTPPPSVTLPDRSPSSTRPPTRWWT